MTKTQPEEKQGTLTLKEMRRIYDQLPKEEDFIIKWYMYPFLWALWWIKGYISESEHFKMYIVDFRNVRYLLKTDDNST